VEEMVDLLVQAISIAGGRKPPMMFTDAESVLELLQQVFSTSKHTIY
jgi:hypothetical protein